MYAVGPNMMVLRPLQGNTQIGRCKGLLRIRMKNVICPPLTLQGAVIVQVIEHHNKSWIEYNRSWLTRSRTCIVFRCIESHKQQSLILVGLIFDSLSWGMIHKDFIDAKDRVGGRC
ncbi:hypothetical protein GQ457_03G021140 [Hibiscus cannabinus]